MGLRYGRARLAAVAGVFAGLLVMPAAALAADPPADVLLDAVVTVVHVDAADGPIAGATITVSTYRDPEAPIQVLTATTDGDGRAEIAGVARAADGAPPVALEIESNLASSVVNDAGCTETASWYAMAATVAEPHVDIVLDSTGKSVIVDCPEPTEPAVPEPTESPDGGVLAATGRPQITPPATDAIAAGADATVTSGLAALLAALAVVALAVLVPARLAARTAGRRRR